METWWSGDTKVTVEGQEGTPIELLPKVFPGKYNSFASEFMLLDIYVNNMKEHMWGGKQIVDKYDMKKFVKDEKQNAKAFKKMRDVIGAWKYHLDPTTKDVLKKQSDRVAAIFDTLESEIKKKDKTYTVVGLKDAWKSFMKGRSELARANTDKFLTEWIDKMGKAWGADQNTNPNKPAGNPLTPGGNPQKPADDKKSKASRLAMLKKERESLGSWSNPV